MRLDPGTGTLSASTGALAQCTRIDRATGALSTGGEGAPATCFRPSTGTGTFSQVAAPSPDCVRADPETGTLVAAVTDGESEPRQQRWAVTLLGGYGSWRMPEVATGTLISGGPGSERNALESERDIRSYFAGLHVETPVGAFNFEYIEGDEKRRWTEPVGGAQVGFVYYQPASSGSLGLNTGANGGRFRIETEVTQYDFRYTVPYVFHRSLPKEQYISEKSPEVLFHRTETRYSASARSINLPGVFTKTQQKVEENRYGIGIRGNHTRQLTDALTGTVGANLALYYRDAELESSQRNVCGAAGCPAANTFTAHNTDSDSGFTWGAGLSARIDYSFTRNSSLGVQLNYDYVNETAALKNPTSTLGISRPPYLDGESTQAWRAALRYRYEF